MDETRAKLYRTEQESLLLQQRHHQQHPSHTAIVSRSTQPVVLGSPILDRKRLAKLKRVSKENEELERQVEQMERELLALADQGKTPNGVETTNHFLT